MNDVSAFPEVFSSLTGVAEVSTRPPQKEILLEEIGDYDVYFASLRIRFTSNEIRRAPRLIAIATPSTGLDHIDVSFAEKRGIAILSLKGDPFLKQITATAELTWALLLAVARHLPSAAGAVLHGNWTRDLFRGIQLSGKTLGILGYGRLGQIVAEYGHSFGMRVLATDIKPFRAPSNVEKVILERLLAESDVVSIHIHLTEANHKLLNRERLFAMKPNAILVNTSRGAIIDELALLEALESGHLGGAGLDIVDGEWSDSIGDHLLVRYARSHSNLIITPHIGGAALEAQRMAFSRTVDILRSFLEGRAGVDIA